MRRALLSVLLSLCLPLSLLASAEQMSSASNYPDLWDWHPNRPPKEFALVDFRRMPDGDILISYSNAQSGTAPGETYAVTFFGRRVFRSTEEALGVPPGAVYPPPDHPRPARLPNGKIVTTISSSNECDRGLGSKIVISDSEYHEIAKKTILLVLDQPKRSPDVDCEETRLRGFPYTLAVFRPTHAFPLSDNTFLVYDPLTGAVLRFDENLNTKSPLFERHLFTMDPEKLQQTLKHYYRPAPEYGVYWQKFFEDLRSKLLTKGGTN